MTASKRSIVSDWVDKDDAPDLSLPQWQAKLASIPAKRGRPISAVPKTSTTIRLDADILKGFRAGGAGWQSRINDALREWLELKRGSICCDHFIL